MKRTKGLTNISFEWEGDYGTSPLIIYRTDGTHQRIDASRPEAKAAAFFIFECIYGAKPALLKELIEGINWKLLAKEAEKINAG